MHLVLPDPLMAEQASQICQRRGREALMTRCLCDHSRPVLFVGGRDCVEVHQHHRQHEACSPRRSVWLRLALIRQSRHHDAKLPHGPFRPEKVLVEHHHPCARALQDRQSGRMRQYATCLRHVWVFSMRACRSDALPPTKFDTS